MPLPKKKCFTLNCELKWKTLHLLVTITIEQLISKATSEYLLFERSFCHFTFYLHFYVNFVNFRFGSAHFFEVKEKK